MTNFDERNWANGIATKNDRTGLGSNRKNNGIVWTDERKNVDKSEERHMMAMMQKRDWADVIHISLAGDEGH